MASPSSPLLVLPTAQSLLPPPPCYPASPLTVFAMHPLEVLCHRGIAQPPPVFPVSAAGACWHWMQGHSGSHWPSSPSPPALAHPLLA
eukprot:scaffold49904_cov49-Cyclotella_meneghiniana.AAC.3